MNSMSGVIGPPVQPIIRELRCSRCKYGETQRMNEDNSFGKVPDKCPRCKLTNCFGVIRVLTRM